MSFDESKSYCQDAFNGTLAVFQSFNQQRFVNDFLFGQLKLFTPVWIGLRGGRRRNISRSNNSHATHEGEDDNANYNTNYNSNSMRKIITMKKKIHRLQWLGLMEQSTSMKTGLQVNQSMKLDLGQVFHN